MVIAGCLAVATVNGGCAVYMAAHQPDAKDLSVLSVGQPRARLIAELGAPVNSQYINGVRSDIFSFTQGYSGGAKVGRAIFHGAADVATAGLWEAVGTPTEGYFSGTQISAEVKYDAQDRVASVVPLKGADEIKASTSGPSPQTGSSPIQTSSTH